MNATYSPDDNKLRLYSETRLDAETYQRVKAAGFRWAPKQGLFVAPMWTPGREDLLIDLCGEIEDEDKSLTERAEERAERFEDYSDNRKDDAERARQAVSAIADNIPLGQPILVGHHSEKHARRDAAKIENGMRRAVKMWEQSKYWQDRAAGALHHAKYKELPSVRARRIKGIEADKRKQEREIDRAKTNLKAWELAKTIEDARLIYSHSDAGWLPTAKHPTLDQYLHAWDVLQPMEERGEYRKQYPLWTLDQVKEQARKCYGRTIARCERWIKHYDNRLLYERAMLQESGGTVSDRKAPEKGGGCKCWASHRGAWSYIQKVNRVSVTVLDNWGNSADMDGSRNFTRTIPFDKLSAIMTKAEVDAAKADGRLIETGDKTGFFISGQPTDPGAWTHIQTPETPPEPPKPKQTEEDKFTALKETLNAGIQVVSARQLFPTPHDLAERIADLADLSPGDRVLEPSAGTGNLLQAIIERGVFKSDCVAIEINRDLFRALANKFEGVRVDCADFMSCNGDLGKFDRIVMNPPFENGSDIKHIEQARTFLKQGGRLVAICANGPRQQEKLQPLGQWIPLEPGTFKDQGTMVNSAIVVIDAPDCKHTEHEWRGPNWTCVDCGHVNRGEQALPKTTEGQGELF